MRLLIWLVLVAAFVAPTSAQAPVFWCRSFDFIAGQSGWNLSATGTHGRYTPGVGFSASNYGTTGYEEGRSVRIHTNFSGELRDIAIAFTNATQEEVLYLRLDFDSAVGGSGYDEHRVITASGQPLNYHTSGKTVSSRLGLELLNSTWLGVDTPMYTIITGITLAGTGANPFGANNCEAGEAGIAQYGINMPFDQMYEGLSSANAAAVALPDNLTAPGGTPLLPATDGREIFAYVKWLISPTAADEYAGPFAPVFAHLGLILLLTIALIAVYVLVYVLVYGVRWAMWLIKWFFKVLDIVFQAIQAIGSVILEGGKALIKAIAG